MDNQYYIFRAHHNSLVNKEDKPFENPLKDGGPNDELDGRTLGGPNDELEGATLGADTDEGAWNDCNVG